MLMTLEVSVLRRHQGSSQQNDRIHDVLQHQQKSLVPGKMEIALGVARTNGTGQDHRHLLNLLCADMHENQVHCRSWGEWSHDGDRDEGLMCVCSTLHSSCLPHYSVRCFVSSRFVVT